VYAILLAAGYGTRLYPLTRDRPKALLPVRGRPLLDYLVDALDAAPEISSMVLVTNSRFFQHFQQWAARRAFAKPLRLLNDGTTCNEERLGAIGDISFALREMGDVPQGGIYAVGTDNLPRFDLRDIIELSSQKGASAVFACREQDPQNLKKAGVAVVGRDGKIVDFEEKPQQPRSNLRVPPFYVYSPDAASLIEDYLAAGNNPDAPGYFLGWLVGRRDVYARITPTGTYDIGTIDAYRAVCKAFERK